MATQTMHRPTDDRAVRTATTTGVGLAVVVTVVMTAVVTVVVTVTAILAGTAPTVGATTPGAAAGDRSPVDLATPVTMADGQAHGSAIVRAGDARIEVLSPTVLRLEYSPTGRFEDRPTANVIDRRTPVPPYRTARSGAWLTVRTTRAVLRYKVGSGPFTPRNTSLQFSVGGHLSTVSPAWEWECTFGQVCQAGAATLGGGAAFGQGTSGYTSTAGYVGNLIAPGSRATWKVLGAPSGTARLTLRTSTFPVAFDPPPARTLALSVDGGPATTLTAQPTGDGQWADVSTGVTLRPGTNSVTVACAPGDGCDTDIDTLSLSSPGGAPLPGFAPAAPLGGWIRGFDTATYNDAPTCGPGESGATCQAVLQPLDTDGLLDAAGWRLLDDTRTAEWNDRGWVQPRPADQDVEDGYLFVYGRDYTGALRSLSLLTGPAPLPTRNVFGVWYSDYTPYSSATIEQSLVPQFTAHGVPLSTLSLDTDWKAPNDWNGWEWNPSLFPDSTAFVQWATAHGIALTLNIHSSIGDNDPALAGAQRVAGGPLAPSTSGCSAGPCRIWDWSSIPQAESNFSLQQGFERQGVSFWWLDWCCDDSVVSMSGLTPDGWIDHLYAQEMADRGQRGFVLARIGGSNADPEEVYPAGPWSGHTSTIAFTGDAWGTWNTLSRQAELTPAEATIGEPYVSDDIGSYLGPPPTQSGADPPDLYDRWVQLGTFQPILRLHSNDEDRLPWQYPAPVSTITENFLRLRQSLVPYTYTLADQAHRTGLPIARPLYLDFPSQAGAYANPTEYLFGPDVVVAPVTSPGAVADARVWVPPGRWVDYFTGATFTGPTTVTVAEPLSRMPVLVRAGGIIPEQAAGASPDTGRTRSLTLLAYAGGRGSFTLYDDAGTGLGYTAGQDTTTRITTATASTGPGPAVPSTAVTIGPTRGHYPGQATVVRYRIHVVDLSRPTGVTLDGRRLPRQAGGDTGAGWSYDPATATVAVDTGRSSPAHTATVVVSGSRPVDRDEPAT